MTTKRTDTHSYGSIVPSEYSLVMMFELAPEMPFFQGVPEWWTKMREQYVALRRDENFRDFNGGCAVCGQRNYKTGAIFRHEPTGELIEMGWMCAEKVDLAVDRAEIERFRATRKSLTLAFQARAEKRARIREFVATAPEGLLEDLRVDHHIIQDIRSKIGKYAGGLSEKQVALVRRLADEVRNAEPEATPVAIPAEFLDGRVEFEATILGFKTVEGMYGTQDKMIVQVDVEGGAFKLYGTAPAKLYDLCEKKFDGEVPEGGYWKAIRGEKIKMKARIDQSDRDEAFGFTNRPSVVAFVD